MRIKMKIWAGAKRLKLFSLVLAGAALAGPLCTATAKPSDPVGQSWRFDRRSEVAVLQTRFAPVVYYRPEAPRHVLVLAFGAPWDQASEAKVLSYTRANVRDWVDLARRDHVLIIAPVFSDRNFEDFRTLSGRLIDPDRFVNALVDGPARQAIPTSNGRICLHGHSAGGQFAARYVVADPQRLECAFLSAPSTYAVPNVQVRWPFGMAPASKPGERPPPPLASWLAAASQAPTTVMVGDQDVEIRPPAPGQGGATRFARGQSWVREMQALARTHNRSLQVRFVSVPGLAHDEQKMAVAARSMLDRFYRSGGDAGAPR